MSNYDALKDLANKYRQQKSDEASARRSTLRDMANKYRQKQIEDAAAAVTEGIRTKYSISPDFKFSFDPISLATDPNFGKNAEIGNSYGKEDNRGKILGIPVEGPSIFGWKPFGSKNESANKVNSYMNSLGYLPIKDVDEGTSSHYAENSIARAYKDGMVPSTTMGGNSENYEYLTTDEKQFYDSLVGYDKTNGTSYADEYLDSIKETLGKRASGLLDEYFTERAQNGSVPENIMWGTTLPITKGMVGPAVGLGNAVSAITGNDNTYSPANNFIHSTGVYQSERGQVLEQKANEWAKQFASQGVADAVGTATRFVYSGAESAIENAVRMAMSMGSKGVDFALLAAQAWGTTYNEDIRGGMPEGTAVYHATTDALTEILTESLPYDAWMKKDMIPKDTFKYILSNIGSEFAEEGSGDFINLGFGAIWQLITDDNSLNEISAGIDEIMAQAKADGKPVSREEARAQAWKKFLWSAFEDAAVGGISGGMSAGGNAISSNIRYRGAASDVLSGNADVTAEQVVNQGLAYGTGTAAGDYASKLKQAASAAVQQSGDQQSGNRYSKGQLANQIALNEYQQRNNETATKLLSQAASDIASKGKVSGKTVRDFREAGSSLGYVDKDLGKIGTLSTGKSIRNRVNTYLQTDEGKAVLDNAKDQIERKIDVATVKKSEANATYSVDESPVKVTGIKNVTEDGEVYLTLSGGETVLADDVQIHDPDIKRAYDIAARMGADMGNLFLNSAPAGVRTGEYAADFMRTMGNIRNGMSVDEAMKSAEADAKSGDREYNISRETAMAIENKVKEEKANGTEEGSSEVHGGDGRRNSADVEGRSAEGLRSVREARQSQDADATRKAAEERTGAFETAKEVKVADLGVENGTGTVIPKPSAAYSAEEKALEKKISDIGGGRLTLVVGSIDAIGEGEAAKANPNIYKRRGVMFSENGNVIARADHDQFTPIQIGNHEYAHLAIFKSNSNPADILNKACPNAETRDTIIGMYADLYSRSGIKESKAYIIEEIVCDLYGGMNPVAVPQYVFDQAAKAVKTEIDSIAETVTKQSAPAPESAPAEKHSTDIEDTRRLGTSETVRSIVSERQNESKSYVLLADFDSPSIIGKKYARQAVSGKTKFSHDLYLNPAEKQRFSVGKSGNTGTLLVDKTTGKPLKMSGRAVLEQLLQRSILDDSINAVEIKKGLETLDDLADFVKEAELKYTFIGMQHINSAKLVISPRDGSIVLSALVKNGEYPVNFDLTKVCSRRLAMTEFIEELSHREGRKGGDSMLSEIALTKDNLLKINDILKDAGYDTACLGCFVESRRANIQAWAESFVEKWNNAVRKYASADEYFGFSHSDVDAYTLTSDQVSSLNDTLEDYTAEKNRKSKEKAAAKGQRSAALTNEENIEALVKTMPQMQKLLRVSDLITIDGRTNLHKVSPELESLILGHYGSNTPKSTELFTPYNNEIELMAPNVGDQTLQEYLFSIGGLRSQSFSDFIITHVFDVVQKTVGTASRNLPAQCYTKVPARARIFGMTGEKINLSVMFNIDTESDPAHAGLRADGTYFVGDKATSDAELERTGTRTFIQSFPWQEAIDIQRDPRYSKNCGIIGVGYSWYHNKKMLADSDIRYIIGYHRSGLPEELAIASHINLAADYTSVQNTYKINGFMRMDSKTLSERSEKGFAEVPSYATWQAGMKHGASATDFTFDLAKEAKRVGGKQALINLFKLANESDIYFNTSKAGNGHADFDLYGDLSLTNDPRKTADNYINWCAENGWLPCFYEFADDPNYYKYLFDFNVYDCVTEKYAPQQAVKSVFPENMQDMVREYMTEYDEQRQYEQTVFEPTLNKIYEETSVSNAQKFSLDTVAPVQPKSDAWTRSMTTDEARKLFPKLYNVRNEDSGEGDSTQIAQTVGTYRRVYDKLKAQGFNGNILDASSGLGFGTKAGREEYGYTVDDIEPFYNGARYYGNGSKPMYTDYSALGKKYDAIISSFVLNVLPQDQRDAMVVKLGQSLNPGGTMFVMTRGKDVEQLNKNPKNVIFSEENMEYGVDSSGAYQKGFKPAELKAYLEDVLGDGYIVTTDKSIAPVACIVRKVSGGQKYSSDIDTEYMSIAKKSDLTEADKEKLAKIVEDAAQAAGYIPVVRYHQTSEEFTQFNTDNPVAGQYDSETPNGIFLKTNDHDIGVGGDFVKTGHGGNIQMPLYMKSDRLLTFKNRAEAAQWYKENINGYSDIADQMHKALEPIQKEVNALEDVYFFDEAMSEEEFDKKWEELVHGRMRETENKFRKKLRDLLNEYFLKGTSGYDAIELVYDGHRYIDGKRENVHTFIVFNESQVKSAKSIVRDDKGKIIPPSQRFNPAKKDIRYSYDISATDAEPDLSESPFRSRVIHKRNGIDIKRNKNGELQIDPENVYRYEQTLAESERMNYARWERITALKKELAKIKGQFRLTGGTEYSESAKNRAIKLMETAANQYLDSAFPDESLGGNRVSYESVWDYIWKDVAEADSETQKALDAARGDDQAYYDAQLRDEERRTKRTDLAKTLNKLYDKIANAMSTLEKAPAGSTESASAALALSQANTEVADVFKKLAKNISVTRSTMDEETASLFKDIAVTPKDVERLQAYYGEGTSRRDAVKQFRNELRMYLGNGVTVRVDSNSSNSGIEGIAEYVRNSLQIDEATVSAESDPLSRFAVSGDIDALLEAASNASAETSDVKLADEQINELAAVMTEAFLTPLFSGNYGAPVVTEADKIVRNALKEPTKKIKTLEERIHELSMQNESMTEELEQMKAENAQMLEEMGILRAQAARADENMFLNESVDEIRKLNDELRTLNAMRDLDKEKYDKEVAKLKKNLNDRKKSFIEKTKARMEERKYRNSVTRRANDLLKMLMNPTEAKHVPEVMRQYVMEIMNGLTFDSKIASKGANTKAAIDWRNKLRKLTTFMEQMDNANLNENAKESNFIVLDEDFKAKVNELLDHCYDHDLHDIKKLDGAHLKELDDILKQIHHMCLEVNTMQKGDKRTTISAEASNMIGIMQDKEKFGGEAKERILWLLESGNLKPIYFFEHLGGSMLDAFNDIRRGQYQYAQRFRAAKDWYDKLAEQHHVASWEHDKNTLKLTTAHGEKIELTRMQALSLYATAKREANQTDLGVKHLSQGGFIYRDDIKVKKKDGKARYVTDAHGKRLNDADIAAISKWLTKEQKAYADSCVNYMSTTLAGYGNETSLLQQGVIRFGETYYFPYKVSKDFVTQEPGHSEDNLSWSHKGFTKPIQKGSSNPVVLEDFDAVMARHMNEMLQYASLAIPQENMTRLFNYHYYDTTTEQYISIKSELTKAFGSNAKKYVDTFLNDLNGNVVRDPREEWVSWAISRFKKGAVLGSLSVTVQQPAAVVRALDYIDPKYFAAAPKAGGYQELMKYSGTAIIKKIGGYDTSMGYSAENWLLGKSGRKDSWINRRLDTMDDVLGSMPEKADEITWNWIWQAAKKETAALHPNLKGEALLKAAGARFDYVVEKTQVYDSIISRSEIMRSKGKLSQMASAFMGEPTVSYNMLYEAIDKSKNGALKTGAGRRMVARKAAVLVGNAILTALAAGLVYGMRDDDDKKTYAEKYTSAVVSQFLDNINVLNWIPYFRDVMSVIQGYGVERMDMEIVQAFADSIRTIISDKKTPYEKVKAVSGSVAAFFGVPVKNVWRDMEGLYKTASSALDNTLKTTKNGLSNALGDGVRGSAIGSLLGKGSTEYEDIVSAYMSGDKEYADYRRGVLIRLGTESGKKSPSDIDTDIAKALMEDDRIKTLYQYRKKGDTVSLRRGRNELHAKGFSFETIDKAINLYENSLEPKEPKDVKKELDSPLYTKEDLFSAIERGSKVDADDIYEELILDSGAKDPEKSLQSALTTQFKPIYSKAASSGDTATVNRIGDMLIHLGFEESKLAGWVLSYHRDSVTEAVDDQDPVRASRAIDDYVAAGGTTTSLKSSLTTHYKNILINYYEEGNTVAFNSLMTFLMSLPIYDAKGKPYYTKDKIMGWLKPNKKK